MRNKPKAPLEWEEQKALAELLTLGRIVFFHIPNGENRSTGTGAKLKAMGVKAGAPDIFIADRPPAEPWARGVFIELKRTTDTKGRTPAQKNLAAQLEACEYIVLECEGWRVAAKELRRLGYRLPAVK